jgi:hypothetical protein
MPDDPQFPRGKLNVTDEGVIEMRVGVSMDVVVIAFPSPVTWFGLPPEQAEQLAALLLQNATKARRNRQ